MKTRRTIPAICIGLLLACAPLTGLHAEGHHQSGISGEVVMATWSPELKIPCLVSVETDSGKLVTTVETGADGSFRVALKPGTYVLTPYIPIPPNVDGLGGIIIGPPFRMTVEKKDYAIVLMPFSWGPYDDPIIWVPPFGLP